MRNSHFRRILTSSRGLRAAGAALITGLAYGTGGGLTRGELSDAAAWLRCLARRYDAGAGTTATASDAASTASTSTLASEANSLGAFSELHALADAAEALAVHPVSSPDVVSTQAAATSTAMNALRWTTARSLTSAARIAPHSNTDAATAAVASGAASLLQLAAWWGLYKLNPVQVETHSLKARLVSTIYL